MFTEISIQNLKSFGDRQRARLAPITLVFGENSSGKSSLIQALRLMKLNAEHRPASGGIRDAYFRGGSLDLGSFETAVFRHELERSSEIGISWEVNETLVEQTAEAWGNRAEPPLSQPGAERQLAMTISSTAAATASARAWLSAMSYATKVAEREVSMSLFTHPGSAGLRSKLPGLCLLRVDDAAVGVMHELARARVREVNAHRRRNVEEQPKYQGFPPEKLAGLEAADVRRLEDEYARVRALLLDSPQMFHTPFGGALAPVDRDGWIPSQDNREDEARRLLALPVLMELEAKELLSRLRYLGPMRAPPERVYSPEPASTTDVGARGERIYHALGADPDLCERVNEWLRERFWTHYELQVTPVSLPAAGELIAVGLADTRTKTQVSPPDVGYGIGQLLPVVVLAVAEEPSILCVEQPEIHLHPRLQGHMADLMIETAARSGADGNHPAGGHQWIAETHSEAIIRRVQRRIREGKLDASDVAVLYVAKTKDGESRIQELRLDETGEFLDEWPGGFFDEGYRDLFGFPERRLSDGEAADAPSSDVQVEEGHE